MIKLFVGSRQNKTADGRKFKTFYTYLNDEGNKIGCKLKFETHCVTDYITRGYIMVNEEDIIMPYSLDPVERRDGTIKYPFVYVMKFKDYIPAEERKITQDMFYVWPDGEEAN